MCRQGSVCLVVLVCLVSAAWGQDVVLVSDINPGPGGGGASWMTVYNGNLYFTANHLEHGSDVELWRFDGTNTTRVADICPGDEGSTPAHLAVYDGRLYFSASGATGPNRLYQYDGTSATLTPGYTASQGQQDLFVFGGKLMFNATSFGDYGTELWKYDGTGQTCIDLWPGTGSSGPKEFVQYNGELYFNAVNQELWKLNATATGATQMTDIASGNGSSPESPAVFNGDIYFSANDRVHGRELWRYNSGDPQLAADIFDGGQYDSSNPSGMTVYKGAIYFSADDGTNGTELWRYDGTSPEMVANINAHAFVPGIDPVHNSWPSDFFVYDDLLYFAADDGDHGRELWSCDGNEVRLVADIYPGQYGSDVGGFVEYNGKLYFSANNGELGGELATFADPPGLFTLVVPEPASLLLMGLAGLAVLRRRRTGARSRK